MGYRYMYPNKLTITKGFEIATRTSKDAAVPANVVAGRAMYLNDDGKFALGTNVNRIPYFSMNGGTDNDVALSGEGTDINVVKYRNGGITGVEAQDGVHMTTTEYIAGSFGIDTPLSADATGKLKVAASGEVIIGYSKGAVANDETGRPVLPFVGKFMNKVVA